MQGIDFTQIAIQFTVIILSLSVHEAAHAWSAEKLGDPTARMLGRVKVPVLFTHHSRVFDETTGLMIGAISDMQATRVRELVTLAGNRFDYQSHPTMGHSMHGQDPALFSRILIEWAATVPN